jgi:hypothetical protein
MEDLAATLADKNGAFFRNDRPSYRQMRDYALSQNEMFSFEEAEIEDCHCTD